MTERFIVDDAGTLIDIETRNTYDYVSDIVGLLNGYDKENEELKDRIDNYNTALKKLQDLTEKKINENEQLRQRNTNQYNQLTELWQIIEEENWEKLIAMKKQLKEDEERITTRMEAL